MFLNVLLDPFSCQVHQFPQGMMSLHCHLCIYKDLVFAAKEHVPVLIYNTDLDVTPEASSQRAIQVRTELSWIMINVGPEPLAGQLGLELVPVLDRIEGDSIRVRGTDDAVVCEET